MFLSICFTNSPNKYAQRALVCVKYYAICYGEFKVDNSCVSEELTHGNMSTLGQSSVQGGIWAEECNLSTSQRLGSKPAFQTSSPTQHEQKLLGAPWSTFESHLFFRNVHSLKPTNLLRPKTSPTSSESFTDLSSFKHLSFFFLSFFFFGTYYFRTER